MLRITRNTHQAKDAERSKRREAMREATRAVKEAERRETQEQRVKQLLPTGRRLTPTHSAKKMLKRSSGEVGSEGIREPSRVRAVVAPLMWEDHRRPQDGRVRSTRGTVSCLERGVVLDHRWQVSANPGPACFTSTGTNDFVCTSSGGAVQATAHTERTRIRPRTLAPRISES